MPVALITGASRGLGRALARELAARGWTLIVDARDPIPLDHLVERLREDATMVEIAGNVASRGHREELTRAVQVAGRLDLLVNNASTLGASPLPPLDRYPLDELERVYRTNVIAPLAITQLVLPALRASSGIVVNVSSDAGVESYEGWGGYGSSKAALDRLTSVLAVEQPAVRFYA